MTCDDFTPFIDTYIDGEFEELERAEMDAHLSVCDDCRGLVESQLAFKREFKACLGEPCAPAWLRTRIVAELEHVELVPCVETGTLHRKVMRVGWVVGPMAAVFALFLTLPEFTVATAESGQGPVIDQTVDWHQGNYPLEITASTPDEVSRWFRGKVDFSVRMPHFPDNRVNLLGGRIAHIQDRRAAYLLYEVDGARLSVLLFQGDGLKVPRDRIRSVGERDVVVLNNKGYGIAVLQDSGVTYTMTSELSEGKLVDLVAQSLELN